MFFLSRFSLLAAILVTAASILNVFGHSLSAREPTPDAAERLLLGNTQWSANMTRVNSTFFQTTSKSQDPKVCPLWMQDGHVLAKHGHRRLPVADNARPCKVLWYGCSDSRVPESVITNSLPGEVFVHRNIANQIPPEDSNSVSVLEYAVTHLKVEHVIIVGHTNCGGCNASLSAALAGSDSSRTLADEPPSGALNKWLKPLTQLALDQKSQLSSKSNSDALTLLVEENVRKQVESVADNEAIKAAWHAEASGTGRAVRVRGWVYDLSTGLIRDLNLTRGPH